MKTLLLSSIALVGLSAAAMAAPSIGVSSPREMPRSLAVLVAESSLPNSGKVSEVIPAGTYTYLRVTKDGKETWLAIPFRDVPVGAEVRYRDGAVMKDFHSGSLNRTFPEVLFLGGVEVDGESVEAVPPGHPPVPTTPPGHPQASTAQENLPNVGQVNEVIAVGTYTYLNVTDGGKETWLAIPLRDIPVGARVRYADGMPMKDFHSASLDRTFAEVMFLGGVLLAEE